MHKKLVKKLILLAALGLGVALSPAAMADSKDRDRGHHYGHSKHDDDRKDKDRSDRDRRDEHRSDHRNDHRDDHRRYEQGRHDQSDHRRDDDRERHWTGDRYRAPRYQPPRGYQRHYWRAGERIPASYRNARYVVHDYRNYRLREPPRQHQWVRVDNDVVLSAVGTGLIAAVVYGIFR